MGNGKGLANGGKDGFVAHVLALDQGTTSSRALVFSVAASGGGGGTGGVRVSAVARRDHGQIYPRPGWVEHDPEEIWAAQLAVAREALASAKVGAGELAAVGVTNQRETTVVWDRRTGRAVCNAIVWQDRRTADMCEQLTSDGHGELIRRRTGLVVDPYFSATKLRWILENVPGTRADAERGHLAFGTVDSFLVYRLTKGRRHITDVSNASRTMLFDLETLAWSDELLALFGVPRAMMPEVVASSGELAVMDSEWLGAEVAIRGIAGDQQASLYGQGCLGPGMAKCTYGTGCFVLACTGDRPAASRGRLLDTVAWKTSAHARGGSGGTGGGVGGGVAYAIEGSVFAGGAVVQWLRDAIGIIRSSAEVEGLARSVADSGGVVFVPAFSGLGAPYWDAGARGLIAGLTRGTSAGHIARAALEAIAHQVADVCGAFESEAGVRIAELRVDGGGSENDLLMQMQADLLGVPVVRSAMTESTAFGVALLAARASGVWGGWGHGEVAIAAEGAAGRVFSPVISRAEAARQRGAWAEAVGRARSG